MERRRGGYLDPESCRSNEQQIRTRDYSSGTGRTRRLMKISNKACESCLAVLKIMIAGHKGLASGTQIDIN
jgi:hypothetical protein